MGACSTIQSSRRGNEIKSDKRRVHFKEKIDYIQVKGLYADCERYFETESYAPSIELLKEDNPTITEREKNIQMLKNEEKVSDTVVPASRTNRRKGGKTFVLEDGDIEVGGFDREKDCMVHPPVCTTF